MLSNERLMARRIRPTLRMRLMIPLVLILVMVMLLIGVSVLMLVTQLETEAWHKRQGEAARMAADAVSEPIKHAIETMIYLALFDVDQLRTNPMLVQQVIMPDRELLEVVRLDAQGRVLANGSRDEGLLASQFAVTLSQWFQQASAGKSYFGDVQISADRTPYLILALPISDGGVIAARLRIDVLWEAVDDIRFGDRGQVYVVDQNGRLIVHTDRALMAANQNITSLPQAASLLQRPDELRFAEYGDFEGVQVVGVSTQIEATDWILIAELPAEEAYSTSWFTASMLVGFSVLYLLLTILVVQRFVSHSVLKPLDKIKEGLDQVIGGDLDYRIDLSRGDEMGSVAAGFDQMVESLHERGQQLAEKIAEQTQTAASLRQSEARYRAIVEDQTELICRFQRNGTLLFVNEAYCRYFDKQCEDLLGHTFIPLIPDEDRKFVEAQVASLCLEKPVVSYQHRVLTSDGDICWMEWTDRAIFNEQNELFEFQSVGRDITSKKLAEEEIRQLNADLERRVAERTHQLASANASLRAEIEARQAAQTSLHASEERLRLALQAARAGVWEWNIRTDQASWSEENYRLLGLIPDLDEASYNNWLHCIVAEDRPMTHDAVVQAIRARSTLDISFRVMLPDGRIRWISNVGNITLDAAGQPIGMYGIQMDITERTHAEAQMRSSLQEKETLLKEIHHRVKNNLQIISSLLSLQADSISDPYAWAQFRDSQSRVRSMALIHERLYRSGSLARIDFATYLHDLVDVLLHTYSHNAEGVTLQMKTESVLLDIDQATPCGLIVNELISNALKHAFPSGKIGGKIGVEIGRDEATAAYQLVVWDDGVGIPSEVDVEHTTSLGLQLVSSLARQLGGAITVHTSPGLGTRVVVYFSEPNDSKGA